jgi:superfamily I DNA and/or RNA helicase
VESWPLQTQSGQGFDLNVSMFERLIKGGLPHAALGVQHRMHPDISRLVRPTYPAGLEDHASVHNHPPLRGIEPGRRVVFVNHEKIEDQEGGFRSSAALLSKVGLFDCLESNTSHSLICGSLTLEVCPTTLPPAARVQVNKFEVGMAVSTVKYLLQQGYAPGQLVVLTPYLGQLLELHRAMRAETQVPMHARKRSHSLTRACVQLGLSS